MEEKEYPNGISKEESEEYLKSYITPFSNLLIKDLKNTTTANAFVMLIEPKPDDPIIDAIPCECGAPNCDKGLLVRKYPKDKIKIQIFEGKEIKTVVINKNKLIERLKEYEKNTFM